VTPRHISPKKNKPLNGVPFPFPELSIFPSPGQTFICLAGEREERSSWKGSRGQRFGHDEEMKSRKPNL
jgi:hypothetical protein